MSTTNKQTKGKAGASKPAADKLPDFYPVVITDLAKTDDTTGAPVKYVATCEAECEDSTDRSAYREAVRLGDVITMGKVIACPWHLVE